MSTAVATSDMARTVALYPWFKFFQNLSFWQAVWFLYFQDQLSASEAILLYAVYDVGTTVLEVPSGYMSDRLGRRVTLIASAIAGFGGAVLLASGGSFMVFAMAQVLLGAHMAFASGTDSALLYEALAADGREGEVEAMELKSWRFAFVALALSAVTGGAMSLVSPVLPFIAGALSFAGLLWVSVLMREPARLRVRAPEGAEILRLARLRGALSHPVLMWLFALSVLMYGFSHIPFVFGQPFILEALRGVGLAAEAPLVSGGVSASMMLLSVATSLIALRLRRMFGLAQVLLFAFALQIGLAGVLAITGDAIAILFLFFRMVPDSLSKPFIVARIQPLVGDESRATYLSIQSFTGRLLFAASLWIASGATSGEGAMSHAEIQSVLVWYVGAGMFCLAALSLAATRIGIGTPDRP